MGFKLDAPTIIGVLSSCIGIGLLVTSCLIVDKVGPRQRDCDKDKPDVFGQVLNALGCEDVRMIISAGSLGIIAGIFQIFSLVSIYYENLNSWFEVHIGVFVLSLIAFSLSAHQEMYNGNQEFVAFFAMSLVSWVWSLLAGGALYYLGGKGK